MTTVERHAPFVSSSDVGEYGHGAKAIERGGEEPVASWANADGGQGFGRGGAVCRGGTQTVYTGKGLLDEGAIDALRVVPERGRAGPTGLNTACGFAGSNFAESR